MAMKSKLFLFKYTPMDAKTKLRTKITNYLKEVDDKSMMGCFIHAALNNQWNFDNLIEVMKEEYHYAPQDMTKCIGEIPMRLILQYETSLL